MNATIQGWLKGLWILLFPLLGLGMAAVTIFGFPGQTGAGAHGINGLSIGQPASDFAAQTLDGRTVRLSDLKGSPVAISFWATWCIPCKSEMPELQSASMRYAGDHLQILAVDAGESESTIRAYLSDLDLSLPVVLDPNGAIRGSYGIVALPVTVWVDAKGIVRAEHIGPLDRMLIDRYMANLARTQ